MEEKLEQVIAERDQLRRELIGLQEMLGFVLHSVGGPVVVTHESMRNGLPPGTVIQIDDDIQTNAFVFSLGEEDE
jgi:hypothetical protein